MNPSQDSDGVSLCSDTAETLINRDQDERTSLSKSSEDGPSDASGRKSIITATTLQEPTTSGTPAYPSIRYQMLFDLSLSFPAVLFAVYGILAIYHDGESVETVSVSTLRRVSVYGPTIFPIAFAAVASNLLKAIAAWRLERGIDVLSLESLLRSRTVFSSVASPISLKAFSSLNILIMALWALSPLGGQATLRVMGVGTSTHDWEFWYLDVRNDLPYQDSLGLLASPEMAQANAAFSAALSSPLQMKNAEQDVFGHVKIPMVEPCLANGTADQDGWYHVGGDNTKIIYSSLAGLPITPDGGFEQYANYSLRLNTSYINATCNVTNKKQVTLNDWKNYVAGRLPANLTYTNKLTNVTWAYTNLTVHSNNKTLLVEAPPREDVYGQPQELRVTTYSSKSNITTNGTCVLETTHVELEVLCDRSICGATRIRQVKTPKRDTFLTVLDGKDAVDLFSLDSQASIFLSTFVNSSLTNWEPGPLEGYFLNPGSPFEIPYDGYSIGDIGAEKFSTRLSQLLNTYWVVSVAPADALNNITLQEKQLNDPDMADVDSAYLPASGTKTTNIPVLQVNRPWLGVLMISSFFMLLAALAAAVLNALRRGPDVLDNPVRLMKDSPYMYAAFESTSMESGVDYTRRMKHVRVCLGDVKADEKLGRIAIGTTDQVVPLHKQDYMRLYE